MPRNGRYFHLDTNFSSFNLFHSILHQNPPWNPSAEIIELGDNGMLTEARGGGGGTCGCDCEDSPRPEVLALLGGGGLRTSCG